MVIEAYSGFTKKPNSTKQPSGSGTQLTVRLKENCSVLNPIFIVNGYNLSHNYIKWGARYYFIDDIVILSNSHAEYICRTDVLATFKSDIGSSRQFVLRSASASDPYIQDTLYPAKASVIVENTVLNSLGFTSTAGMGTFILGVLSEESSGSAVAYYSVGPGNFPALMQKLFDPTYLNASDISTDLQKELVNPMQYIASCYWMPFVYDVGTFATVKFGWWDSGVNAFLLSESDRIYSTDQAFTLPVHPQNSRGIYLNDAPYTRHTLNCYTFGSIPLDPAPFVTSHEGHIYIDVDVFTGIGQCYIDCYGARMFNQVSQIGVPIQLSQSTGNIIGSGIATFEAIGSAVAGNVLGATHGIISAVSNAMPQVQTQGANGSIVAYLKDPNIVSEFRQIVDEDNAQIGRPLCQAKIISTLSGFIACENADLDSAASLPEKDQIVSYMNSGFYYE